MGYYCTWRPKDESNWPRTAIEESLRIRDYCHSLFRYWNSRNWRQLNLGEGKWLLLSGKQMSGYRSWIAVNDALRGSGEYDRSEYVSISQKFAFLMLLLLISTSSSHHFPNSKIINTVFHENYKQGFLRTFRYRDMDLNLIQEACRIASFWSTVCRRRSRMVIGTIYKHMWEAIE